MGTTRAEVIERREAIQCAELHGHFTPQELAERTADDWRRYGGMACAHFDEMKGLLARREPDYAH